MSSEGAVMPHAGVHVEITGGDPGQLQGFYGALFGWNALPGSPVAPAVSNPAAYAFTAPDPAAGGVPVGIGGGHGFDARVTFYVGVDDVRGHLARAVELGATVVVAPSLRPDGAVQVAQFADPQGNIVGLARLV
jgi:predicted enzyme related to lactoylglutathione lyase